MVIIGRSFVLPNIGTGVIKYASNIHLRRSKSKYTCTCLDILSVLMYTSMCSPRYLHISGETFGRPISGQSEVSAYSYTEPGNEWKAMVCVHHFPL